MLFHSVTPVDPVPTGWTAPDSGHDQAESVDAWSGASRLVEQSVIRAHPGAMIIRSDLSLAPGTAHFATPSEDESGARQLFSTHARTLVEGSLDLLIDGERGIWRLPNQDSAIWYRVDPGDQDIASGGEQYGMRHLRSGPGVPVNTASGSM